MWNRHNGANQRWKIVYLDGKNDVDFTSHNLVAKKRHCGRSTTPEKGPNFKIDQCKEHCHGLNKGGNLEGYWWKPYRGGYCGCCKSIKNLTSNWPDANTYSLESSRSGLA